MKQSQLRNLIREEISNIIIEQKLQEDIFDKIFDSVFGKIKNAQIQRAKIALDNDSEFQKLKSNLEKAEKLRDVNLEKAKKLIQQYKERHSEL